MSRKLMKMCLTAMLCVVGTAAWALSEVNGVYQIGTAEDLEEFTALVNEGNRFANALLTADIVKSSPSTMIGTDAIEYEGIFDGAGHSITIDLKTESRGIALFRWVGRKGIVKNLKVQGEITTSSDWAAAIAVETRGIVRGCYVDVKINSTKNGDATDGAIAFRTSTGTIVEDCLAKLNIQGASTQNCGGVVGWANGKTSIVNCLAINSDSNFDISNGASNGLARNPGNVKFVNVESYNADNYANRPDGGSYNNYVTDLWGAAAHGTVTQVNVEDLADGRICYQLNNDQSRIAWVQNIGTDPFPVPAAFGTGQVYASVPTNCAGKAEGDVTYSNNGTDQATKHTLDAMGICTTCGYFDFHAFDYCYEFGSDRYVKLANKTDIDRCEVWNKAIGGFKLNMKMVDDIEYKAEPGRFIFNATDWVDGDFNGDGHVLTIEMSDITANGASFIPCQYMGTFENVIMHGSITTTGQYAASISSWARQNIVRNVYSDVTINANNPSDNTAGGFFGIAYYNKSVENCIYAGNIGGGPYIGGFSGWANDPTTFTNCAVLGNAIGKEGDNSQNICRNPGNVRTDNCYVVNLCPTATDNDKVTHYTNTAGIASGELAFLLNGNQNGLDRFYQVIGTDPEPMPIAKEGGLVYCVASEYRCDGVPTSEDVTYSNADAGAAIPAHTNVDGWCTVCGTLQEDYLTPVDGWYEISNGKELSWFSNYVAKYPNVKARLTADINMDGNMTRFIPIGSQASLFVGEFDGQGHKFSNFVYSGGDYSGLFGVIGGGAVIKNFVLDNTCSITGNAFCGIVGGTNGGGDVYLSNLGNEGPVTGTAQNVSGILGVDMGGSATLHITNCYVMGAVVGARESAVICSWSNGSSVVENCWSTATLSGKYGNEDSFTRGSAACVNCYEIEGVGTQNNKTGSNRTNIITAEEVANGALCIKLNTDAFGQVLGTDAHPVFNGPKVYLIADEYVNGETADGDAECILPSIKWGGEYDAYTWVANADFDFGAWNEQNPNYNVIIGVPAEQDGKAWYTPGFSVDGWNYGKDLPNFGDGRPADVYAVRYFTVDGEIPGTLYMPAPHDDAPCEYYINGEQIWAETDGWYEDEVVRLTDEQKALIKTDGSVNVFAFHVHQNWGGRYADGGLYTAGAPVDAFNNDGNKKAIDATIAIMEAQGIGAEEIEYASNINYRNGFAKGLAQLRKARRLAFDGRTETFTGTAPADGMIAYIYNVGAKMFLAGGNDWGTHASLNHMGAKCVLHANSSGENRYAIQTNLPNGRRGANDGLGHNGYVDCGYGDNFTTSEDWAWTFEALADGTYHIINSSNSGDNIYLGMTDDDRLQIDTDKAGADNDFNKWLLITPEEFTALAQEATIENPVDLGHLIHQATFSQNDFDGDNKDAANDNLNDSKWERNAGGIWNWKGNSAGGDYMFEMWNTKDAGKVYLYQEVEGLPAGKYTVQMSGYYRDGNFESADEGNVRQLAYLFAGSEENCVPLQSIVEGSGKMPGYGRGGASGIVIPDGCYDAAKFFQVGAYVNTIEAEVGADGKLKIGVFRNADDVKERDWIVTDNWRLFYKGNPVEVEVGEVGYATFVAPGNVKTIPAEVEAFAAQLNNEQGYVHLEPVSAIPAGEAVVLKADEGTYTIYANAGAVRLGTDNDLVAATDKVTCDGTQYILASESEGVGFYKGTPSTTIAPGKGYLVITNSGVKGFYPFSDDDATGIAGVGLNVNGNDVIYNVAGQRLQKVQKGINIINGKKVLH